MKKYRTYNAKYKNRIAQFYEILHTAVDYNKGLLADIYYNEFRGYLEGLLYGNVITVNAYLLYSSLARHLVSKLFKKEV